ncbi:MULTISPECIES: hypothetical protein [unclassified Gordonia (in: high G+C Gram-positive bacteria)]|uniref:hypothetical protein n=1 Tax=unclassified Gordonia (in: high G+C Gram-positive bacteria) TaxID=2657482 RepID=UPI001F065C4C|nr:hypothetical protein [Gordonia sp. PDNC005]
MNTWACATGIGLLATTFATIAFVVYRQRESAVLKRDAELALTLRDLAAGDPVRLAAVDEFETAVYKRLFYTAEVGPKVRSAAWGLLGAVLSGAGALALDSLDGVVPMIMWGVLLAVTVVFVFGALAFAALALYAAATTPRVTFVDADASDEE